MRIQRWAAFTSDPSGGNPAGVALADAPPDPAQMQRVATEIGFSETAFLAPRGPGRFWCRYYAPAVEVGFCGHASIASAVALVADGTAAPGRLTLATSVGDVAVEVGRSDHGLRAVLTSPPADGEVLHDAALRDRLLRCFGWDEHDLDPDLPVGVGRAGEAHPIVALSSRAGLAAMRYDYDGLRTLMRECGWTTVQVVHREDPRTFHARDPFPVGGVVEDPATGAAAAALGGYLRVLGQVPGPGRLGVHQGVDLGRPSLLEVEIPDAGGIRVGGHAIPMP